MNIPLVLMAVAAAIAPSEGKACSSVPGDYDNIPFCTTCVNDDLQCKDCSLGRALKMDKTACIDCPANCFICEFETAGASIPTCKNCTSGYYLESGLCKPCLTSNCRECSKTSAVEVCSACNGGYILDSVLGVNFCQLCPSACKDCSLVAVDLINKPTCDSCLSGYYKKKTISTEPVYSCSSCASTCTTCTDNGSGGSTCTKCTAGYALNSATGTCVACSASCQSCDFDAASSTTVCNKCVSDRFQLIFGTCSICTSNCASCSSVVGVCSECDPYYRLDTGSCTACDTNCIKCDATSCIECASAYVTKAADDKSCDACSSNCIACDQNGCLSCLTGYRLDVIQKTCIKCPTGCSSCSATSCISCESAFVLYSGTCYACPGIGCSSTTTCTYDISIPGPKCTACAAGYVRNGASQTCDLCPLNCGTAGGDCLYNTTLVAGRTTVCANCMTNYAIGSTDGLCQACPPHCPSCTYNSTINAMDCDQITGCAASSNATVLIVESASADTVAGVSIVAGQTYCKECSLGCGTCNATLCSVCLPGYTLDAATGTCLACPAFCASGCAYNTTGTNIVNCVTCTGGYGIDSLQSTCSACDIVAGAGCSSCTFTTVWECNACVVGYAYDPVAKTCGACASHCLSCTVAGECTVGQCEAGYAHRSTDNKCYKCPTIVNDNNCLTCGYSASSTSTVPDVCNFCVPGYALADDNTCKICPDHCNTCTYDTTSSRNKCNVLSCEAGYALNSDEGTCHACPPNCGLCTWDTVKQYTVCVVCGTAFFTNNQVCASCPPNCQTCEVSNGVSLCITCNVGFALDNGFCRACLSNCAECSSVDTCSICRVGYGKTADSRACTGCAALTEVDNCVLCNDQGSASKPAGCLDCSVGYTLADNALQCLDNSPVSDCLSTWDPPPKCTACNSGFDIISNGFCGTTCSKCGTPDDMDLEEECNAENLNYTVGECVAQDTCMMIWRKDTSSQQNLPLVARGCFPNVTCSEDEYKNDKVCSQNKVTQIKECKRCCRGANCNDFVFQGQAAVTSSVGLLLAAVFTILTLRRFV